jgi:hypothetical protein
MESAKTGESTKAKERAKECESAKKHFLLSFLSTNANERN